MSLPQDTYTIEGFVKSGSSILISYDKLAFSNTLTNGTKVCIQNVLNDYMYELKGNSVWIKLSDEEFKKYKYSPKLLSYDIYGNAELYFIILLINDIADVKEFDKQTLRMVPVSILNQLLTSILNAEQTSLNNYNNRSITG